MSLSNAIQTLIYQRLTTDATVVDLVGDRVYDPPRPQAQAPYISFGATYGVDDGADCIDAQSQTVQIDVWSEAADGQRECKAIVDAVRKSLHLYDATLPDPYALVEMRVDLTRVMRDPDECWHGVVQVEVMAEEL